MMIIAPIRFCVSQQDAEESETILRKLRDASLKEPAVIRFKVDCSQEKPHVLALREVYRDQML